MTGTGNKKWKHLYNKIGTAKVGDIVTISKVVGNWGRLLGKKDGKWQWIYLKKVKEM